MSLKVENRNQEVAIVIENPTRILPGEVVLEIFSRLNLATLGTICTVSQDWKYFASEPNLVKSRIYEEVAFGNDKWAQCGGQELVNEEDNREEFSSLPWNEYIADCKKFKSVFPEKKSKDTLMLVRLPKNITLKNLGELAKRYFPEKAMGYRNISDAVVDELGDKAIDKSRWVLMTKEVLPGSRSKSYDQQKELVAVLGQKNLIEGLVNSFIRFFQGTATSGAGEEAIIGYEVPATLEAAACIFAQYFASTTRLFSNKPLTYTRCKETVRSCQVVVGGFAPAGLYVTHINYDNDNIGVAALRKF